MVNEWQQDQYSVNKIIKILSELYWIFRFNSRAGLTLNQQEQAVQ